MSLMVKKVTKRTGLYALVVVVLVFVLFVPFFMIATSLKGPMEIQQGGGLLPQEPTLDNFVKVLAATELPQMILNSLIVGLVATGVALVLGLPAAYAIARYQRDRVGTAVVLVRAVPAISLLVPYFVVFANLRMIDTYLGLIIAHTMLTVPLLTWLMVGFFRDLPSDLEDAAYIDGATVFRAFISVMIPLSRGGIAAASILSFIFSWNNLIFAAGLAGSNTQTVPLVAFKFLSFESIQWGPIAAAATLVSLPVIVLAMIVQRQIVAGLAGGAVKE